MNIPLKDRTEILGITSALFTFLDSALSNLKCEVRANFMHTKHQFVPHREQTVNVTKSSRVTLFFEIIGIYWEHIMKYVNTSTQYGKM